MGIPWELGSPSEEYVWERDLNHVTPLAATPCPVSHHAIPVAVVLLHLVQTRVTSMLATCDAVYQPNPLPNKASPTSDGLNSVETIYQSVNNLIEKC